MFDLEYAAFRETFKYSQPTFRRTMAVAAVYAAQATICLVALEWIYRRANAHGDKWAVISAILALQPGFGQSVVTAVLRVAANTVGASMALLVGHYKGTGEIEIIAAIVAVVFICETLRLQAALRTACVAVIIVMTVNEGSLSATGFERFVATVAGCAAALVVQIATDVIRRCTVGRTTPITPEQS